MVDRSSPRIGCVADYPLKLRIQALEFVNLWPRDPPTPSVSDLPSLLSSTTTLCGKCDLRFTFLQVTITSQHHFDFSLFFLCCLVLFQYHLRPSWIHFSYFFTCEGLKCMTKFSIPHCAIQTWHHVCILSQTNWAVKASKTSWRFCLLELCVM